MLHISKLNLSFHITILLLFCIVYSLGLSADHSGMRDKTLVELKQKSQTYSTTLEIIDDPQTANYVSQVLVKDLTLGKRTIAKSTAATQQYISSLEFGDQIVVQGYLEDLDFYNQYRKHQHVVGMLYVTDVIDINQDRNFIETVIESLRARVQEGCSRLNENQRGICEGLIIGERGAISRDTYSTFKEAQLTHLLVASGANIALMLSFLSPLILRLRLTSRNLTMIAVAVFYCMLVRFEPSMIRASVMVIIPSVLEIRGYKVSKFKTFIGTLATCALLDPFLLFRVGFWLSAAAVFGLLFISPILKQFIKSQIFCDTMGASLMTQPILWLVFGFIMPGKWWSSVPGVALAGPITTFGCSMVLMISFIDEKSFLNELTTLLLGAGIDMLLVVAQFGAAKWSFVIGLFMLAILIFAYTRSNVRKQGVLYCWRRTNIESR